MFGRVSSGIHYRIFIFTQMVSFHCHEIVGWNSLTETIPEYISGYKNVVVIGTGENHILYCHPEREVRYIL